MAIPLKVFSKDDPEPGRLWIGLPVTFAESTSDTSTQPSEPSPPQPEPTDTSRGFLDAKYEAENQALSATHTEDMSVAYEFEAQWIDDEGEVVYAERLCARDLAAAEAWAAEQERFECDDGYVVERVEEDSQELNCECAELNEDGVSESWIGYGPGFRGADSVPEEHEAWEIHIRPNPWASTSEDA
jgi:hypothetical protein